MPDIPPPGFTPTGYQRTQGGSVRWDPPSPEHLAKLLPQYEIECLLGRGGMGAVYRARQKSLDRPVAIKILPPEMGDEEMNFAERFKNEARTMAKMNHPAIVHVHDFGETSEGQLYIVMEYIDGTDVAKMILSQGRLPSEHALAITAHVCDALQYAHKHGVIHRDIKPANILIDMEGAVKVADFGLAKAMDAGQGGLTQTNMAVGTPDYVAPEALMSGIVVDGRADLYAVGVMLYTMLTGNVPRGSFPLPSKTVSTDPRFDQIILKAMEMDREMRYQTAFDIRKDLDVILSTPHVEAGGKSSAAVPKQEVAASAKAQTPPAQKPVAKGPQQKRTADSPVRSSKPGGEAAKMNEADRNVRAPVSPAKSSLGWIIPTAVSAVVIIGGAFLMRGKTVVVTPAGEDEPVAKTAAASPPIQVREEPKPVGDDVRSPTAKPATTSVEPANTAQKSLVTSAPTAAPVTASTKPTDQTLASSATSSSDPNAASSPAKRDQTSDGRSPVTGSTKPTDQTLASSATSVPPTVSASPTLPVSSSPAQPTSALDQRLAALDSGFQAAVERDAGAAFKASIAALDKSYLGALDRALAAATQGGKLEEAVALRAEKQRIEKGEGVPSEIDESTATAPVPDALKTLRKTYRSTVAQHEATKAKAMQPLYDKYDQALAAVQTELTQAQKLDDALRVKAVREQIAASRGGAAAPSAAASGPTPTNPPKAALAGASALPFASSFLATKDKPLTNSLGMKFVPVPGTDILMCIHETRRQDYAAYAAEESGVSESWKAQQHEGIASGDQDNHPVVGVSWKDAQAFCAWLSKKEGKTCRLPTDREWSVAVGIGRKEKWTDGTTPEMVKGKVPGEFPWNGDYPPKTKDKAGNYCDSTWKDKFPAQSIVEGYTDGFVTTAPVMNFKPNNLGIHDLGGNVWEWCDDWENDTKTTRVLRGSSFSSQGSLGLRSDFRFAQNPATLRDDIGFRVVLETRTPASTGGAATKPSTPPPTPPAAPPSTPATAAKSDFTNSLGMKFVQVPGTQVLFCIHETRKGDYAKYATATPGVDDKWRNPETKAAKIPVSTGDDHPAVNVSWDDARAFSAWLSKKEGRTYRLPTDREWSFAVGIGREEKEGETPVNLHLKIAGEYPWGKKWPPPEGAGNYADTAHHALFPTEKMIEGYTDGYATTAPVMCFKPNKLGIYDLGGNVWEWCEDWYEEGVHRTLRGGTWNAGFDNETASSVRFRAEPFYRQHQCGFRIVLETDK